MLSALPTLLARFIETNMLSLGANQRPVVINRQTATLATVFRAGKPLKRNKRVSSGAYHSAKCQDGPVSLDPKP